MYHPDGGNIAVSNTSGTSVLKGVTCHGGRRREKQKAGRQVNEEGHDKGQEEEKMTWSALRGPFHGGLKSAAAPHTSLRRLSSSPGEQFF